MVKGLGKNLALQLIESMGEDALERMLDNEPEKLLAVKGIKEKKLEKILATWHRFKDLKALSQFLIPLGGTPALVQRIYRELKEEKDLIAQIEENPYRLTAVKGVGFKTADRIAKAMGIAPAHPFRIRACIDYVLFEYTDSVGNSCIDRTLLASLMDEELSPEGGSIDPELFQEVLREMASEDRIVFLEDEKLTSSFLYNAEKRIYATVSLKGRQFSMPVLDDIDGYIGRKEEEMGIVLSDEQREAIRIVNRGPGRLPSLRLCRDGQEHGVPGPPRPPLYPVPEREDHVLRHLRHRIGQDQEAHGLPGPDHLQPRLQAPGEAPF